MATQVSVITRNGTTAYTLSTGGRGPKGDTGDVATNIPQVNPASTVVVDPSGTDTERGTSLVAAYAAAKLLTPNGAALSATNRTQVILPPGKYKITPPFLLDADFVDFVALMPASGGVRLATDVDLAPDGGAGGTSLIYFRPPPTLVYTDTAAQVSTMIQTAADVRLTGFGIAHTGTTADWIVAFGIPTAALMIGASGLDVDNSASEYDLMYFWSRGAYFEDTGGVRGYWSFRGTWRNCIASSCSFRTGYGDMSSFPASVVFSATMTDCEAGPMSFMGDAYPAQNYISQNSRFERCRCVGKHYELNADPLSVVSGFAGFAGCTAKGMQISATIEFIDCISGPNSFGNGNSVAGTFRRCIGANQCFGATVDGINFGSFTGYAEDCIAGPNSFGGRNSLSDASNTSAYLSGTLVRCTGLGNTRPINIAGATIRDSRITVVTSGQDALVLLDNNSQITNSELIVAQGGAGIPIDAAVARNVVASGCRMNNATNDADGLGPNVTNLVSSAGNVVSNSIR